MERGAGRLHTIHRRHAHADSRTPARPHRGSLLSNSRAFRRVPVMRERSRTLFAAAFLCALNAWITLPLFHTDYTRQMGSIEAAYIGLARYVAAHFTQLNWFPLWYGGIPYPDTYPPLLHWVCGLVIAIAHASPGLAHHA